MPTVAPGSKVLVTGASGFVASWVVHTLLERGFHVRGTVRSSKKGDYLANLFADKGKFEYVVVEDIEKDGAFDEAVNGVDAVEHTASPFHYNADDPNELIGPAVKGTVGILESIKKYGSTVQRVVITSSIAAMLEPASHQQVLTEENWNNFSVREVEAKGKGASSFDKYRASKSLAEKAAWDFVAKHKDEINFDITAVNPPFVFGPTIHEVPAPSSLNTSIAAIYAIIKGKKQIDNTPAGNFVDVRDFAQAHVEALTTLKAGGERFLISSGPFTWQDFVNSIHTDAAFSALPKGESGTGKDITHPVLLDTTKAKTILGMKFRGLNETAVDSVKSLLEREKAEGW